MHTDLFFSATVGEDPRHSGVKTVLISPLFFVRKRGISPAGNPLLICPTTPKPTSPASLTAAPKTGRLPDRMRLFCGFLRARPGVLLHLASLFWTRVSRGLGQPHKLCPPGATPGPATIPAPPSGPVLVRVCCWCQSVMGFRADPGATKTTLTHGLCPGCQVKFERGDPAP